MPKGIYTQGVCILLDRPASLDQLEGALADFEIVKRSDTSDAWEFGGPTLVIAYRPEVNGLVAVDTISKPWPDHMGDPTEETMIFGAWSMGHFGPFTFPGGLQRAAQQSWLWKEGKTMPERHKAFVRIRSSYVFGVGDNAPVLPKEYAAIPELEFVTKIATSLLGVPGSLCYFNPNGEVLRDQDGLREALNFAWSNNFPPLDIWSNVRLFNINPEWSLMDTVGNGQLDIPDVEACFHSTSYDFNEVDEFLRNVSLYLLGDGEPIDDDDTMEGPGDIAWQSHRFENGIGDPPRAVLRWLPLDDRPVPKEISHTDPKK